jgi:ribosomal protein S12 methylthiotransferase accessory factor
VSAETIAGGSTGVGVGRGAATRKAYRAGTDRVVEPAETLDRVRPLFPLMGITRVADVTGLDHIGIPVVMVVRPNARSLSVAQGKGVDFAAAAASGVMESIEAWHAERLTVPLRLGSVTDLRWSLPLVDTAGLPRCAEVPFSDDAPLLWCEGRDLVDGESCFVPYELVHTNYTLPRPTGAGLFLATSNGLASGNVLAEATSHALCEVIERDATTLWHLHSDSEQARTRIDLDTVDEPLCRQVLDAFERAAVAVGVWETTTDVGVPSFYSVILDREDRALNRLHAAAGMGCHPRRSIALLRALTEAAQSRLTVIAGSRDDVVSDDYRRARAPHLLARERELLVGERGGRAFTDVVDLDHATIDDDITALLARLQHVGITQVVSVDLTRPDIGVAVVRVIVPGLEAASEIDGYQPGPRARAARQGRPG